MLASQNSLVSVQINRNTAAELAESPAPLREAALETFRRRNAVLDAFFYDIGNVSADEARRISPWLAREGTILIVPPSGRGDLQLCADLTAFEASEGRHVRILAVAGVGSSALGSAAFGRNVADAFGEAVAVVVSGYGLADVLTEAAGGLFYFGTLNQLRHQFESLDDAARRYWQPSKAVTDETAMIGRRSLDTRVVKALLASDRFKFSVLIGHSKGNLVLSEVLYEMEPAKAGAIDDGTWLLKISAAVSTPKSYKNALNIMGAVDWFGGLNSRMGAHLDKKWPFAWHHTNTELPFSLPVTKVLNEVIKEHAIRL